MANSSLVGAAPYGLFVDKNNTLYVAVRDSNYVQIFLQGSFRPNRNISGGLSSPMSLVVAMTGEIYVDNGVSYIRVDVWAPSSSTSTVSMSIPEECYSIFIDTSNHIYCAATFAHQIVKKWLGDNATTSTMIAGTGGAATTPSTLYYPVGVFVDLKFNLYVADCGNHRIQLFPFGQANAITVAGDAAPNTVTLNCPNAVMLDANGYLFITDNYDHRVLGSGPLGFRCLFGCSGVGSTASQLYYPRTFSFDTYGNIFVADTSNNRIQKFLLISNSCSEYYLFDIF